MSNNRAIMKYPGRAGAALLALGAILLIAPLGVAAHGVELSYETVSGVEITARYDSGEPMAGGQVSVFAPDNPAEPWLTGFCDDSGKFYFTPDGGLPGLWEIQVRLGGHGDLIRLEVTAGGAGGAATTGFTAMQKLIMTLTVIWGLAGTALFFSRRKN